jgi:hypothetical protein
MKNIFIAIVVFAFIFSSCGNNSNKKTNIHTHDDGTEHINHDHAYDTVPDQEVFELDGDSLSDIKDTLNHTHENEHSHSHDDGHEHTH